MALEGVIGIMGDSHGRPETIRTAVELFRARGCSRIFHLGDICDSSLQEDSGDCVRALVDAGVSAIKGNNDHVVALNNRIDGSVVDPETVGYLERLPMLIEEDNIAFTHSLPFPAALGIASLMRVVEGERMIDLFDATPYRILFRGHGHAPCVVELRKGVMVEFAPVPGSRVFLDADARYVITCGALAEGHCILFDVSSDSIELLGVTLKRVSP